VNDIVAGRGAGAGNAPGAAPDPGATADPGAAADPAPAADPGAAAPAAADSAAVEPAAAAVAAELFTAISVIRRTARRTTRQVWAAEPLPPAQSELLRLAAARPGMTVADAAQELRLAPNTVSTLVGRLAEAGLLSREKSAHDGRTVQLAATDKARQRLAEFRDLRAELAGRAIERMSGADRQMLAAAAPTLLRLAERMEAS
jgi:DNA-binding MarR family transcriptional regulator